MIVTVSGKRARAVRNEIPLNTEFLGLDFLVVTSSLPSDIVTALFQLHLGGQSQRMMELCCSEALDTCCSESP